MPDASLAASVSIPPAKSVLPLAVGLRDAARLLGVSERTAWTLVNRGDLPHVRIGNRLLFRVASLDAWLQGREQSPALASREVQP